MGSGSGAVGGGGQLLPITAIAAGLLGCHARTATVEQASPAVRLSRDGGRFVFPPGYLGATMRAPARVEPVRSVLNVDRRLRYGDYVWNEGAVPRAGHVWIRVDRAGQTLSVFRAGQEIGTTVILYGAANKGTPTGTFPILAKAERHRSSIYDADMPFMLQLTGNGVAIHASDVRQGHATHGCVGVPLGFARRLFATVRRGDLVQIE